MQLEPEHTSEELEVAIRREDRQVTSHSDCTDQEIGVRTLDAPLPASVVRSSSVLVIDRFEFEIGECAQVLTQVLELWLRFDPGQELLPHWPNGDDTSFLDELGQLTRYGVIDTPRPAERERPHGGVN
jgi:hypothetical protein